MERTGKPNTYYLMKQCFEQIAIGLLIIAFITFGWWGSAIGSDSLLDAQKQTLESPPPDPSGAGSPGDNVSCHSTTIEEVERGDTIRLYIETVPPAGNYAVFEIGITEIKVPGAQGEYELQWQVPEDASYNPSFYYHVEDSQGNSLCEGRVNYRLTGAPRISYFAVPTWPVDLGYTDSLWTQVTGSADLTYEWTIGDTQFTDGPTDKDLSYAHYTFNKVGTIAVTVTVTNEFGSVTSTKEVVVKDRRPSVQFTKQPSGVIAPAQTVEWCIRYSASSVLGLHLTCSYGDGASFSQELSDYQGTVCVQHAYQNTGVYQAAFTFEDKGFLLSTSTLNQSVTVAGCPPGYEKCGDGCMPAGKGCCDDKAGYCEVKPLCCGDGCCTVLQFCHEGKGCCDIGSVACTGQANCCAINQTCCPDGGCCEGPCCGSGCCGAGEQCCDEKHCCPSNKVCTATGCADQNCLPSTNCCPDRPVVCPSTCCATGLGCCGDGCMPNGSTCCGPYYCPGGSGQTCCGGNKCCPTLNTCCPDGGCCAADFTCCGGGCCPNTAVCTTDGYCCAQGWKSCKPEGGSGCCPGSSECCGGSACCAPGTCNHSTGQCTGSSTQSLKQMSSGNIQRSAVSPSIQTDMPEVPAGILKLITK